MKVKLGAIPLLYPIPIVLIGANVGGKPNYATLGDCAVMGIRPALVCISSGNTHYTNVGILENGAFSINVPATRDLALADFCGMVSGRDVDKGAMIESFYGELGTAPMASRCPVNLECQVVHEFSYEHRQMFVARVAQAYIDEEFVTGAADGRAEVAGLGLLDPIIYALDNRYYRIGDPIGRGYQEGKALMQEGPATPGPQKDPKPQ